MAEKDICKFTHMAPSVPNPSQIGPIWDGFGTDLGGQFRPLNMAEKDIR